MLVEATEASVTSDIRTSVVIVLFSAMRNFIRTFLKSQSLCFIGILPKIKDTMKIGHSITKSTLSLTPVLNPTIFKCIKQYRVKDKKDRIAEIR